MGAYNRRMFHLFHPAFVHFSVAFLVAGPLAESWGLLADRDGPRRFGSVLVLLGLACLVPTILTGTIAANSVDMPAAAHVVLDGHERAAWILLAVFLAGQFWKASYRGVLPPGQRKGYATYLVLAMALTIYTALLGGRLVYGHGVGVEAVSPPPSAISGTSP